MDQLIISLLAWIVAGTGLAAPEPPRGGNPNSRDQF